MPVAISSRSRKRRAEVGDDCEEAGGNSEMLPGFRQET